MHTILFIIPLIFVFASVKTSRIPEADDFFFDVSDDEDVSLLGAKSDELILQQDLDMHPKLPEELIDYIFRVMDIADNYQLSHRLNKSFNRKSADLIQEIFNSRGVDLANASNDLVWRMAQFAVNEKGEYAEDVLDQFATFARTSRLLSRPRFLGSVMLRRSDNFVFVHCTILTSIITFISVGLFLYQLITNDTSMWLFTYIGGFIGLTSCSAGLVAHVLLFRHRLYLR